jgi:predicted RNA-binding protein YlxR (DUF448 family)
MQKVVTRICAFLREVKDRQSMFRVVKTPNHEIKIDLDGKLQGRGAYLSKDKSIIENAKKRHTLEKALKVNDCQNIYDQLLQLLN